MFVTSQRDRRCFGDVLFEDDFASEGVFFGVGDRPSCSVEYGAVDLHLDCWGLESTSPVRFVTTSREHIEGLLVEGKPDFDGMRTA